MRRPTTFIIIALLLIVSSTGAHAADNNFVNNLLPSTVQTSLKGFQSLFNDFMSFVLDVFSILLFVLWIAILVGIVWGIVYITQLPKAVGAQNIQDAIWMLGKKFWEFIR